MTSDEVRLVEFDDESLPAVLRWQVLSFLRIIWPEGFTGELRYRDWITNPVYQPYHLLCVAGDLVVSHLEIVQRLLDHEGVKYKAYAPTGVLTFPRSAVRDGLARLVQRASRWIETSSADLGLICCEPESAGFYAQSSGWDLLSAARIIVGDDRAHAEQTPQVLLATFITEKAQCGRQSFLRSPLSLKDELSDRIRVTWRQTGHVRQRAPRRSAGRRDAWLRPDARRMSASPPEAVGRRFESCSGRRSDAYNSASRWPTRHL